MKEREEEERRRRKKERGEQLGGIKTSGAVVWVKKAALKGRDSTANYGWITGRSHGPWQRLPRNCESLQTPHVGLATSPPLAATLARASCHGDVIASHHCPSSSSPALQLSLSSLSPFVGVFVFVAISVIVIWVVVGSVVVVDDWYGARFCPRTSTCWHSEG